MLGLDSVNLVFQSEVVVELRPIALVDIQKEMMQESNQPVLAVCEFCYFRVVF